MKFSELQINPHQFYILGMICFAVIVLGSAISLESNWGLLNLGGKASALFYMVFYSGLIFFFNHLYHTIPKIPKGDIPTEAELEDFMKDLK